MTESIVSGIEHEPMDDAIREAWAMAEGFLLRVAGQPAHVVVGLRSPASFAWAEGMLELEGLRDDAAERLRTSLENDIAEISKTYPEHRIGLINLRRDVFNGRRPKPSTLQRAAPALSPQTTEHLDGWLSMLDTLVEAAAQGEPVMAAEITQTRAEARRVLADDRLRSAVLLQSEVLERNIDKYLDPTRKVDKSSRNVERALLELMYRAALKTSPLSTLTSVALGRLSETAATDLPSPGSMEQGLAVATNVAIFARLASTIISRSDLRAEFAVAVAPGASVEGDLVRYVRRRRTANPDPDAIVSVDTVHEDLFFLPSGPALADVVRLAPLSGSLLELTQLVLEQDADRSMVDVEDLLGHLLRLGFLLVPDLQIDMCSANPAVAFIAAISGRAHPSLVNLTACLVQLEHRVATYSSTPARARASVLIDIRNNVAAAFAAVEAAPGFAPRTLIYEDAMLPDEGMTVSRSAMEGQVLEPLAPVAEMLPAFDLSLPRRLTAAGFFKARYGVGGVCEDLERFCYEFQRDFFGPYASRSMRRKMFDHNNAFVRQENWFKLPEITALDDARETAAANLREAVARAEPGQHEIQLGTDFAWQVCSQLLPSGVGRQPWSFFVQLADRGPDSARARCVLNQAYAGSTLMFSRFVHQLDQQGSQASELLTRTLAEATPNGAVLAELRGGYETTNLNIHPALTSHELVCPGDVCLRPETEQITLSDLILVHDVAADRVELRSRRLDRRVIPLYLGFLMPMALPEVQQVLLCFSPIGMAQIDLWAGTGDPVPTNGITFYPRLLVGDLVLQRAMWKMPKTSFPVRGTQESVSEYYLRVQRWRNKNSLPSRVFAQVDNASPKTQFEDEPTEGRGRKAGRKPLPVDFQSWPSIQLAEQMALGASSRLVLTEALPDTTELWLADQEGEAYVTELLVELYPKEGKRHV